MIRIRYATEPYIEIDLEGTNAELADLHRQIKSMSGDELEFAADCAYDPAPYQQSLRSLRLRVSDSLIRICVQSQQLDISGRADLLKLFADNLPWDASPPVSGAGYHVHFDRNGMESYVAEDSLGVILSLRRSDSSE